MLLPTLGIDIAKLKFNVCLINPSGKPTHKVFANTADGFQQLTAGLIKQGTPLVYACMEATGAYGEALALHRHEAGHQVSVINPAAIKACAGSRLSRTKTDRVDAELIARCCQVPQPPAWTPPAAEVRHRQALVRRVESLVEMHTMESNRLEAIITNDMVKASVEDHIAYLNHQIEQTEALIRTHSNNHPTLKQQSDLLAEITDIGAATAATLLAEITDITQYESARQVAAYAGLVPRERPSGSSVRGRTRRSKIGNARVRKALYFPAITARRCSPFFQAWAEGLRQRGKCKMSVIGAAMRKLIHLAYGVLKTGRPFDPQWTKTA